MACAGGVTCDGGQTFLSVTRETKAASNGNPLNASRTGKACGGRGLRWGRHSCLSRAGEWVGVVTRPEPTRTSGSSARPPVPSAPAGRRRVDGVPPTEAGKNACPTMRGSTPPNAFPADRFHVRDAFSGLAFEATSAARVTDKNVCPPSRRRHGSRLPLLRVLRAFVVRPNVAHLGIPPSRSLRLRRRRDRTGAGGRWIHRHDRLGQWLDLRVGLALEVLVEERGD